MFGNNDGTIELSVVTRIQVSAEGQTLNVSHDSIG